MANDTSKVSVLFVCLGNICRSTMAEGVFRNLSKSHLRISNIDSAGTGAYHTLDPPDHRTMSTLRKHGIVDYDHGARQVTISDFEEFDYVFAMDKWNLRDLEKLAKRAETRGKIVKAKVMLFGEFGEGNGYRNGKVGRGEEVDDPYYGEDDGFERVFEQVSLFSRNFLDMVDGK